MAAFATWRQQCATGPVVLIGPGVDASEAAGIGSGPVRVARPLGRSLRPIDSAVRSVQGSLSKARVRPWGRRAWQWCATRGQDLGIACLKPEIWADREVPPPRLVVGSATERAQLRTRLGVGDAKAVMLMGSPPSSLDVLFAAELLARAGVCGAQLHLIVPEGASDLAEARQYLAATRTGGRVSAVRAAEAERSCWCADVALFSGPATAGESRGRATPSSTGVWWAIDAGLLVLASTECRLPTAAVEYASTGIRDGGTAGISALAAQLSVYSHGDVNAASRSLLDFAQPR